ncbi:hypothetical protein NQ314_017052 [Rhamnusium bicolor]|uniref:Uncharacterized protein n=1 Tax=Rhamnusium bicolor TaxID=1586634 RepID=A0AAV8WU83_9CUCU|nr:hypothetical protein NQ314_017052 [Rhamnusium bicolor]
MLEVLVGCVFPTISSKFPVYFIRRLWSISSIMCMEVFSMATRWEIGQLCPTSATVDEVLILDRLGGEVTSYFSVDSVKEDPED